MKYQHDSPMVLHDAHRDLSKWLNEEQTKPIDRVALATLLGVSASYMLKVSDVGLSRADVQEYNKAIEGEQE